nr:hypothetical protein [uncultured Pedobacter sp.]
MKILFITSMDFGEMNLAAFFARNQPFKSAFVIPAKRLGHFGEVAQIIYSYNSVTELERIIANEKPDVISLNTAYLIVNGKLGTLDEFKAFYQYLMNLGLPIITTDPFVRVYDGYPDCHFELDGRPLKELTAEVRLLSDYLKDLPHIYGFPCISDRKNTHSFYNDKYCIPEENRWHDPEEKDYWLFVLGELDSILLLEKYGDAFMIEFATRLKEICENPKNIVRCVLPKIVADAFRQSLPKVDSLQILDYMTLKSYENLISESGIVFYWNVFSNSIMLCYYYDVPFLCFDKGHIANLSLNLYEHMSASIYRSGKPEFIDFFSPIEPDLDTLLQKHYSQQNRQNILKEYHQLPSPQHIIETLIND